MLAFVSYVSPSRLWDSEAIYPVLGATEMVPNFFLLLNQLALSLTLIYWFSLSLGNKKEQTLSSLWWPIKLQKHQWHSVTFWELSLMHHTKSSYLFNIKNYMLDAIILLYRWAKSGRSLNVEVILPRVPGWIIGHCQCQDFSHACLIPKSKHLDSKQLLFGYLKSERLRQEKQEYCQNSLKHGFEECVITMPSRYGTLGQSRGPLGMRGTAQRMNPVRAQWERNPKGGGFSTYPQHIVTRTHGQAPLLLSTYACWEHPFTDRGGVNCNSFCVVFVQLLSHVWLFSTLWAAAHQASLSLTNSWSLLKLMSIESVMPSNHLILCHPLLMPSVFLSIKIFSIESVLRIRWPKYWPIPSYLNF